MAVKLENKLLTGFMGSSLAICVMTKAYVKDTVCILYKKTLTLFSTIDSLIIL